MHRATCSQSLSLSLNKISGVCQLGTPEIKNKLTFFSFFFNPASLSAKPQHHMFDRRRHGRVDVPPPLNLQCPGKNQGGGGCRKCLHVIAGLRPSSLPVIG